MVTGVGTRAAGDSHTLATIHPKLPHRLTHRQYVLDRSLLEDRIVARPGDIPPAWRHDLQHLPRACPDRLRRAHRSNTRSRMPAFMIRVSVFFVRFGR